VSLLTHICAWRFAAVHMLLSDESHVQLPLIESAHGQYGAGLGWAGLGWAVFRYLQSCVGEIG